jgi:hypothetical protein
MVAKLQIFKTKAILPFMLVLCLTLSFISPVASAYVMATHVHACHNDTHKDDCIGTEICCKICLNFANVKNQPQYYSVISRLSTTALSFLSFPAVNFDFQYIPYISLISLKVRFNN